MRRAILVTVAAAALVWPGCGSNERKATKTGGFELSSPAFTNGQRIPKQFTWFGRTLSPPLEWRNAPQGTRSYALISDYLGQDTRRKVMWIAYNIPDTLNGLPAGAGNAVDSGGLGLPGGQYMGPGGLINRVHRYRLTLYALDTLLNVGQFMVDADTLRAAMAGRVLDSARLEFTYEERGGFGHWWK